MSPIPIRHGSVGWVANTRNMVTGPAPGSAGLRAATVTNRGCPTTDHAIVNDESPCLTTSRPATVTNILVIRELDPRCATVSSYAGHVASPGKKSALKLTIRGLDDRGETIKERRVAAAPIERRAE